MGKFAAALLVLFFREAIMEFAREWAKRAVAGWGKAKDRMRRKR